MVTIDSPVTGFDGLDNGYSALRTNFIRTLDVQKNGLKGVEAAVSPSIVTSWLLDLIDCAIPNPKEYNFLLEVFDQTILFVNYITEGTDANFGTDIATDLETFSMKDLATKIMNNSSATDDIQQITDMGKDSAFVKKYVGQNIIKTKREKAGSYWTIVRKTKYKKKFGKKWKYYKFYRVKRTKYRYVNYIDGYNKAYSKDIQAKIGHIVGTENDPMQLIADKGDKKDIKKIIKAGQYVFSVAQGINKLKAISFNHNIYYTKKANDCYKAGSWLKNFKSNWGDLIGGRANDGFITEVSQVLPGTDIKRIKRVKLDHRTVGMSGVNLQTREIKKGYDAEKKNLVYKSGSGALDQILIRGMGINLYEN